MNQTLIKNISPSNFGFVMATGILSIVFQKAHWSMISLFFLLLALFGYMILVGLFITRMYLFKYELLKDFGRIQKMFKYLAFSAGSNSLAVGLTLAGFNQAGLVLGFIGVVSTLLFTYILFCSLFFHIHSQIEAISPFWLLLAIAYHSSGIVITTLLANQVIMNHGFLLLAFGFWTFGILLYFIFMTLNLYRMIFFPFKGEEIDPGYWTCMGAAAIAIVDGGYFISLEPSLYFLDLVKPFIEGMLLFLWAWGTAWIPILCLMAVWKYLYYKVEFRYYSSLWAFVFPLGMYTDSLDILGSHYELAILTKIAPIFLWISFTAWLFVAYVSRLNPLSGEGGFGEAGI